MSLSSLLEQDYIPEVSALETVLGLYHQAWTSSQTLESRQDIEDEAIALYNKVVDSDIETTVVDVFDMPNIEYFDEVYTLYKAYVGTNSKLTKTNIYEYLNKINSYQLVFNDLLGLIKRIKQKQATLNLWSGNSTKYIQSEKFMSTVNIDSKYTSVEQMNINTIQGIATLPIQDIENIRISDIKLGSNSNGQPGNSDVTITTNNQDLNSLINVSENFFEYERLDTGPCQATFILSLNKPQIINRISIKPENIGYPISVVVKQISITTSDKQNILISDLLTEENDDMFNISDSLEEDWQLSFLPVEAISIAITLEQTQSHIIDTIRSDGKTVSRERYAIAIKQISLQKISYKDVGGLNSISMPIKNNIYAVEPRVDIAPVTNDLFDFSLEASYDDGVTWTRIQDNNDQVISLIDSNSGTFIYRVTCSRKNDAFSTFTSFIKQPETKVSSMLRSVSRYNSPVVFSLNTNPKDENTYVIQPKLAARGAKERAVRIGTTTTGNTNIKLPFNIIESNTNIEDVKLYVAGEEYVYVKSGISLSANEWSISDDYKFITLSSDLSAGLPVEICLNAELMLFEQTSDGYVHKCEYLFDPDKANISITRINTSFSKAQFVLPRNKTVIYLGWKNIKDTSFTIKSNVTWTRVYDRLDVYDAEDNDYYVDCPNGILYLASAVKDDHCIVAFEHQVEKTISDDQYEILYDINRPIGILISPEELSTSTYTETIDDDLNSIIDPITGEYTAREEVIPMGSTNKKQFSHGNIIKGTVKVSSDLLDSALLPEEVQYIDGVTEFLGLTLVNDEETNATAANGSGVVQFSLSARSLWYMPFSVQFSNTSVFSTLVNSSSLVTAGATGSYYISSSGDVYVKVGVGNSLLGNIKYSYYFKNSTTDASNKYSIDYKEGILYSYGDLNPDANISYKVATYKMYYDIAKEINAYQYSGQNNTVSIRTENMEPVNNLVKVLWQENIDSTISSDFYKYFTPLITLIGFRFS